MVLLPSTCLLPFVFSCLDHHILCSGIFHSVTWRTFHKRSKQLRTSSARSVTFCTGIIFSATLHAFAGWVCFFYSVLHACFFYVTLCVSVILSLALPHFFVILIYYVMFHWSICVYSLLHCINWKSDFVLTAGLMDYVFESDWRWWNYMGCIEAIFGIPSLLMATLLGQPKSILNGPVLEIWIFCTNHSPIFFRPRVSLVGDQCTPIVQRKFLWCIGSLLDLITILALLHHD